MSKSIRNLDNLTDSRIMFEKDLPPFGYAIVFVAFSLLIGAVIWSLHTPKIFEVISTGTVTNAEANYVMSAYEGTILDSYMEEGKIVSAGDTLFTISSADFDLQIEQLENSKSSYENKIAQLQKLVRSIQNDTNYFNAGSASDSLYYSTYEAYKSQIAQNSVDVSQYKEYGYTDKQIESELITNSAKLSELYYSTIRNTESEISACETQISEIDAQLSALKGGQEKFTVTAPTSGQLHMLADYKEGMVVQSGAAVASISPENDGALIEAFISSSEKSRIHNGDSVEMEVNGLMQSVYGTIPGTVVQISSNATSQENDDGNTSMMFKVLIHPDTIYVVSNTGDKVDLTNGMTVEARIQYKEITYFNYVMQKLGIKAA